MSHEFKKGQMYPSSTEGKINTGIPPNWDNPNWHNRNLDNPEIHN